MPAGVGGLTRPASGCLSYQIFVPVGWPTPVAVAQPLFDFYEILRPTIPDDDLP